MGPILVITTTLTIVFDSREIAVPMVVWPASTTIPVLDRVYGSGTQAFRAWEIWGRSPHCAALDSPRRSSQIV